MQQIEILTMHLDYRTLKISHNNQNKSNLENNFNSEKLFLFAEKIRFLAFTVLPARNLQWKNADRKRCNWQEITFQKQKKTYSLV